MELVDFLRARYQDAVDDLNDCDLRELTDSARAPGWYEAECRICLWRSSGGSETVVTDDSWSGHIENVHQRTQSLVDVDAKRRIVDLHKEADYDVQGERTCARCVDPDGWTVTSLPAEERWPCETLRLLALPFADHPDFDESWRV